MHPRIKDPIYIPAKKKKKKVRWTFPKSLFVKWIPDDAELVNLCFEYDWENTKVHKIVKNEEEVIKVREFFRSRYSFIAFLIILLKILLLSEILENLYFFLKINNFKFINFLKKQKNLSHSFFLEFWNFLGFFQIF